MKSIVTAVFAAFALVVCAGPAQAQTHSAASFFGNWNCAMADSTMNMSITTSYQRNGQYLSRGVSQLQTPNGQLDLDIVAAGQWSVQNGQLTEAGGQIAIFSTSLAGQPIAPGSEMYNTLMTQMNAVGAQPNVRNIVSVTPEAYTITYQGYSQTCTRA